MGKRDTEEESEITKPIDTSGVDGIVDVDTTTVDEIIVEGKTKTSTTYAPNNKGDAFKGGHWAGASGGSDWLQKDFSSPQLVTGVYVGEASTDITTEGFRLVFKLKKPNGEWVTIDELNDVNINRTALSGGAIGKSIPSYTKRLSSAIEATAFRLEFYGNGWFDATDIRIYTSKISNPPKIDVDGIVDIDSEEDKWHKTIVVTTDNNIFPDPSVRDEEADSNNYVIDGDESHAWVRLFFQNSALNFIQDKSLILKLTISGVSDASSQDGLIIYCGGVVVGRVGAVTHNQIVETALDMSKIEITDGSLELILKAAGTDAPYIKSRASGEGAELKIVFANKKIETAEKVNELQEKKDTSHPQSETAIKLINNVPRQNSSTFKRDVDERLRMQTTSWDKIPYRITTVYHGTIKLNSNQHAFLAGNAAGTIGWDIDNFLLIELSGGGSTKQMVVGEHEPVMMGGSSILKIGRNSESFDAGEIDLTPYIQSGRPINLKVTAFDYGGMAKASDVYLVIK